MRGSVLVALLLEGVLPGLTRLRRPVPAVRFDRVRETRTQADRRAIARRLLECEPPAAPAGIVDLRASDTRSSSASTGGAVAFFRTA